MADGALPSYRTHDPATAAQASVARPDVSAWVSANAGSGKTRVLTNRVARLLLAGAKPDKILCLTYTKAAAAEMQNRLFDKLGAWSMMASDRLQAELDRILCTDEPMPDLASARRLFAQALETPGGLKIQTIHAFCESLLSRFPLEAGVSPHFSVIDEVATRDLIAEARDSLIERRDGDVGVETALDYLLGRLNEYAFGDLLSEIVGKRASFDGLSDPVEVSLAAFLGVGPDTTPERELTAWHAALDTEQVGRIGEAMAALSGVNDKKKGAALSGAARASDAADCLTRMTAGLLTQELVPPARSFPTKEMETLHPWALEPIATLQRNLMDVHERLRGAERLTASAHLARFATALLARYSALKAERAGLDYDDLIDRVVTLLERSEAREWVRFKLDGGVEHLLVDEAQDTSPKQWAAISALAEEFFVGDTASTERGTEQRTIFAVGDEKQSIYSFQGAAPEQLDRFGHLFRERATATAAEFVQGGLATSFRSTPTILSFVDRVFEPEAARQGLVFGASSVRHEAFRATHPGRVELWPLLEAQENEEQPAWDAPVDAPPNDDPKARLAALIAETIKGWIGKEPLRARGRTIRAGDIMILVRGRGALSIGIIKNLKKLGVPVAGEDRLSLPAQLAVKDVLALARFCLFPEDDLTLATVLRSPFCDVSEDLLFDLAHHRRGTLWYALLARRAEHPNFESAAVFLEDMVRRADFLRPYELLAHALGPGGGRARLLARLGGEAEDPINELLGQALAFETAGSPTLQAFVDWITEREAEIKREHEQGRDEVRVMTAHGAKGLEAPVVILPDTTTAPSGGHRPTLLPVPAEGTPPIWVGPQRSDPIPVQTLRDRAAEREEEEHRRLLYVALTRAEDRLLICGAKLRRGKLSETSWYTLCQNAIAATGTPIETPVCDDQDRPVAGGYRILGQGEGTRIEEERTAGTALDLGDVRWLRAVPPREAAPSDISPSRLAGAHGGYDPERLGEGSPFAPDRAARRGTLIHALLEVLPEVTASEREQVASGILAREAADWRADDRAQMIREALGVFEMHEAATLFGPGSAAEVPVGALLDDLGPGEVHGVIDRLVVEPERVLIVDFKTGIVSEAPPEAYLRQLAVYAQALRHLYPDRPVDTALLWTARPRLDVLDQTLLSDAFTRAAQEVGQS
ncbi:MAG: double-strand break repair helicase AddA [Pseudomonadota bacterium]